MSEQINDIVTHQVTLKQFRKFMNLVRGKKWKYFICGDIRLKIENEPTKYFPSYSTIKVSAKQADNWARCALGDTLEKRGGRLTVKYDAEHRIMWIG